MAGRLEGRIALVTGASRGIGRAVALKYAAEGAQLVLVARTVGGLEELDDEIRGAGGLAPTLVPLDLSDGEGVDRLGGALFERHGRLDVLVGNAGALGVLSPVGHIKAKVWDATLALNLTANWRLIRSMDPLLRRSDAGRAIFVTSGVTVSEPAYWGVYTASKAGLEALVRTWSKEIEKTDMRVNILDPGVVRTKMRAQAFPGEDPMSLPEPATIAEAFVRLALPTWTGNGERLDARNLTG